MSERRFLWRQRQPQVFELPFDRGAFTGGQPYIDASRAFGSYDVGGPWQHFRGVCDRWIFRTGRNAFESPADRAALQRRSELRLELEAAGMLRSMGSEVRGASRQASDVVYEARRLTSMKSSSSDITES